MTPSTSDRQDHQEPRIEGNVVEWDLTPQNTSSSSSSSIDVGSVDREKILQQGKKYLGKRTTQFLLVATLLGGVAHKAIHNETSLWGEKKDHTALSVDVQKNAGAYMTETQRMRHAYWNDEIHMQKHLAPVREVLGPGVVIYRDAGARFYEVQPGDGIERIITKLSAYPEFAYLAEPIYRRRLQGSFNIATDHLRPGMKIPIPLQPELREIPTQEFLVYMQEGIERMRGVPQYAEIIDKLIDKMGMEAMQASLLAYARSETATDYQRFSDPVGRAALHRRENHMNARSVSLYHILLENNADGSPGPGLRAMRRLGFTKGQCEHPIHATMLALGYMIEKTRGKPWELLDLSQYNLRQAARTYNGSFSYAPKLKKNRNFAQYVLQGGFYLDGDMIAWLDMIYYGINAHNEHVCGRVISEDQVDLSATEIQQQIEEKLFTHLQRTYPRYAAQMYDREIRLVDRRGRTIDNGYIAVPGEQVFLALALDDGKQQDPSALRAHHTLQ